MRNRFICVTTALLLASGLASAYFALPPFETTLRDYDIVVTGGMREIDWDGREHCHVMIDIADVILGDVEPGDTLQLEWSGYWEAAPKEMPGLGERIFLLRPTALGFELETLRIIRAADRDMIEELLREFPIRVRPVGDWRDDADWGWVDLVYLNTSDEERVFSGVRYQGGQFIAASEETRLEFTSGFGKRSTSVSPREGAFAVDSSVPDIVVPARSEASVRAYIPSLFEVRVGDIQEWIGSVYFEVEGGGEGHSRVIGWHKEQEHGE